MNVFIIPGLTILSSFLVKHLTTPTSFFFLKPDILLPHSTSLNDLDNATLHIDGQSTEVDALSDIVDLDENDDIIDDEDTLPHDLAYSDDEDLINFDDDDGVDVVYSSEEEDLLETRKVSITSKL
ncbi:hypothetical protein Tco_1090459 [Tanacetum coccineum]|uniref:Uncharacterized protein n=1 Tax=Tanacetum coccineum TaxID=301880 RepID=A0ABQ5I4J4_9ASTR